MTEDLTTKQLVEKEVVHKRRYYCDWCQKRLFTQNFEETSPIHTINNPKVQYFEITTGHNDWGNDSVDSQDNKVLCTECLHIAFSDYIKRSTKSPMNTEYLEIEHKWNYDDEPDGPASYKEANG